MAEPYPIKFTPIPQERIWGGHQLKSWFSIQEERPIGEYWLVSAHPNALNVVQYGAFSGMSLNELTQKYPDAYLGQSPQKRFPLLIKLIEAADDLSVQVHPDDSFALQWENDYGKTEAWYILDTWEQGEIVYGHTFSDKDHFLQCVREKKIPQFLERRKVHPDELVYVPAGTLHAILKGTVLLEIQQTSDVTYRVYDWDRVDREGKSRTLHTKQAADVIRFGPHPAEENQKLDSERKTIFQNDRISHQRLLACPYFTIEKIEMQAGNRYECSLGRKGNPDVLIILNGEGSVSYLPKGEAIPIRKGDALLIPATLSNYEIHADTDMKWIRTFY
jgi:mannose-6-phosphate isomerase